jgi:hypothetical protein
MDIIWTIRLSLIIYRLGKRSKDGIFTLPFSPSSMFWYTGLLFFIGNN